jgi:DNA topoisomerase I
MVSSSTDFATALVPFAFPTECELGWQPIDHRKPECQSESFDQAMVQDPKSLCRRFGLTHVETSELCLRRRRCGKGFRYLDAEGRTVRDKALKARIRTLAIPPAWTEVCIAADERAHIQAIGRDPEGRLQYRYHPEWNNARAVTKHRRLKKLGTVLPKVRSAVTKALVRPGLSREKVVAAIVRLIDRAVLRPGYEEYARGEGGRGASTLLKSDVAVEGDKVVLDFKGKGGKNIQRELRDPLLARVLRKLAAFRGKRLFGLADKNGSHRPVTARDVNEFLATASGVEVTAKDFRTFKASATALAVLTEHNGHESDRLRKKAIVKAADEASKVLANTRNVARSSYIHPAVIKAYETGRLETSLLKGRMRKGLNRIESALVRFLERTAV